MISQIHNASTISIEVEKPFVIDKYTIIVCQENKTTYVIQESMGPFPSGNVLVLKKTSVDRKNIDLSVA